MSRGTHMMIMGTAATHMLPLIPIQESDLFENFPLNSQPKKTKERINSLECTFRIAGWLVGSSWLLWLRNWFENPFARNILLFILITTWL